MMQNEQGDELRQNVGARNPYEMVNFIQRKKDLSKTDFRKMLKKINNPNTTKKDKNKLMKNIINRLEENLGKKYHELFDPKYCSPLYPGLPNIWGQANLSNPSCSCTSSADPFFSSGNTSAQRTEVCQGAYGDCFFVAALYSLVWIDPSRITRPPSGSYYPTFFLNISTTPPTVEQQNVTYGICPNTANGCGTNAHWAAIYEKAYSAWLTNKDSICPSIVEYGNPITALSQVSRKPIPTDKIKYTTDIDPSTGQMYTGKGIFDYIQKNCCEAIYEKERVARPMVAYTYLSAFVNPHNTNPDNPSYIYDNCAIPANHSFSILGVHLDGTKMYIILRNPYGPLIPDPVGPPADPVVLFPGTWSYTEYPKYVNGVGQGTKYTVNLSMSLQDGIFGLECDYFRNHFEAFGWAPI